MPGNKTLPLVGTLATRCSALKRRAADGYIRGRSRHRHRDERICCGRCWAYQLCQAGKALSLYLAGPVAAPGGRLFGVWNTWCRPGPPNLRAGDCELTKGSELSGRTLTAATAGGSLADGALQAATASAPSIAIRTVIMPPFPFLNLPVSQRTWWTQRKFEHPECYGADQRQDPPLIYRARGQAERDKA